MRVVVTGHAGHVGGWVVQRAPARADIEGIDVAAQPPSDIRSPEARALCAQGDAVIHLAALIDVAASVEDPVPTMDVNVNGTANLLAGARGRFVLFSSAAAYGDQHELPVHESAACRPISPYGESKLAAEAAARAWEGGGRTAVILRPFNIYSPHQDPRSPYTGVISTFIRQALRGDPVTVHGDGEQTRDFVHASDVADAAWRALDGRPGTYNIGCGKPVRIAELAQMVIDLADSPSDVVHGPARAGDIRDSWADVGAAAGGLGWSAAIALRDGLAGMVEAAQAAGRPPAAARRRPGGAP